jgi:hypothetical protein
MKLTKFAAGMLGTMEKKAEFSLKYFFVDTSFWKSNQEEKPAATDGFNTSCKHYASGFNSDGHHVFRLSAALSLTNILDYGRPLQRDDKVCHHVTIS